MSRSRRISKYDGDDQQEENDLECRALYCTVTGGVDSKIRSRDDLEELLRQSGRDASPLVLHKYWKSKTRYLNFDDFLRIWNAEPQITARDLVRSLREMDAQGEGYIWSEDFVKAMTKKGEKLPENEVMKIVRQVEKKRKVYYRELAQLLVSNVDAYKKQAVDSYMEAESSGLHSRHPTRSQSQHTFGNGKASPRHRKRFDSDSEHSSEKDDYRERDDEEDKFRRDRSLPRIKSTSREKPKEITFRKKFGGNLKYKEPSNLKRWEKWTRRGCFFFEDHLADSMQSQRGSHSSAVAEWVLVNHSFEFTLSRATSVLITMVPFLDLRMLENKKTSPDLGFVIMNDDKVIAVGNLVNIPELVQCRVDLSPGTYQLMPYTSLAKFKRISPSKREADAVDAKEARLTKKDRNNEVQLTTAFREALTDIFTMCDLDASGGLSKEEFNLYNIRTCGEELSDDLWEVVEDNCKLKDGEIRLEDFMQLNLLEAKEDDGNADNLWITLTSMGFNRQLFIDQALPFEFTIYVENSHCLKEIVAQNFEQNMRERVNDALAEYVMAKGERLQTADIPDCAVYVFYHDAGLLVAAHNRRKGNDSNKRKSHSNKGGVHLTVDCSASQNLVFPFNHRKKCEKVVSSNRPELVLHGVPSDARDPTDCILHIEMST